MLVALPGCSEKQAVTPASEATVAAPQRAPAELKTLGYVAGGAQPAAPAPTPDPLAARKLIRTGQLNLEVQDFRATSEKLAALARTHGGYVGDTQVARGEGDRLHGTLSIRVPAERFETVMAAARALGKVLAESVGVQDVTKAYTDLETRLRVKRDAETRLREILRTRTARLSDVLEAERELARVTEEIERMEGERRYYDQQVALSTITVALAEPDAVVRPGLLDPVRSALRGSLQLMSLSAAALISVVVFVLPWLLVLTPVALLVRARRRRRRTPPPA